jgi:hypothetical protein
MTVKEAVDKNIMEGKQLCRVKFVGDNDKEKRGA